MAKNISEYEEEIKKFSEIPPNQLMIVAFGRTEDGRYVPIKVTEDGKVVGR